MIIYYIKYILYNKNKQKLHNQSTNIRKLFNYNIIIYTTLNFIIIIIYCLLYKQ